LKQVFYILFILSTNSSICQLPYNQLVFPDEIHKYPLLFISEINNRKNEYNYTIEKFIEKQEKRGFDHHLIEKTDLKKYNKNKYRYVVYPTFISVLTFYDRGSRFSKNITYYFYDRQTGKRYRDFARSRTPNKEHFDPSYPTTDLYPAETKNFTKDLSRIIRNLEKKGVEKTFRKEWNVERRAERVFYGGVIALPVITSVLLDG